MQRFDKNKDGKLDGRERDAIRNFLSRSSDSEGVETTKRNDKIHTPKDYDPKKEYPLILNLHGYRSNGKGQLRFFPLKELSEIYETELTEIGDSDDSGILKVWHDNELVCELDNSRLHDAPTRRLNSSFCVDEVKEYELSEDNLSSDLKAVISDFAIGSREPIIREYDHEVQGNTVLKPLAGSMGAVSYTHLTLPTKA